MDVTAENWKNKAGTSGRSCSCGSWKQHWENFSGEKWPSHCSVLGCGNEATVGAHIYNADVQGEQIVPMCDACNQRTDAFDLKDRTTLVSANKSETCEK